MFEPVRIHSVHGCADLEGSLGYMCFCDPNMDHLHLGLSVGWLVSLSKDLLKNLTIIDKILLFSCFALPGSRKNYSALSQTAL